MPAVTLDLGGERERAEWRPRWLELSQVLLLLYGLELKICLKI